MRNKRVAFAVGSILVAALLAPGVAMPQKAHATTFIVTIPFGPHAGQAVILPLGARAAAALETVIANRGGDPLKILRPQASLSVSPLSLAFSTTQGANPSGQTVTIANTGPSGSLLNWSASASAPWLGMSQATGTVTAGGSTDVTVGIDITGLAAGTYTGTITISDPTSANSPQTVNVTIAIVQPAITLSAPSLAFNTTQGANPANQTVALSNSGPSVSVLNWSAASSQSWITLSQTAGTLASGSSINISVGANASSLAPGTYNGTVTVSDPNASNNPQTLGVTLTVAAPLPPPAIEQLDHSLSIENAMAFGGRQKFTVNSPITMSGVELYISNASDGVTENSNVSIYAAGSDDSTLGSQQGGTSNTVSLLGNAVPGTQTYSFSSPITLQPGTYWIVPSGNDTSVWGTTSNTYAGGYWYGGLPPGAPNISAYFRMITQ